MLQQALPEDFVIATGRQFSVRDFVNAAALELGLSLEWQGHGLEETGTLTAVSKTRLSETAGRSELDCKARPGSVIVRVDPRYFRPTEVDTLLGDPGHGQGKTGLDAACDV